MAEISLEAQLSKSPEQEVVYAIAHPNERLFIAMIVTEVFVKKKRYKLN